MIRYFIKAPICFSILIFAFFSCRNQDTHSYIVPESKESEAIQINLDSIKIVGNPGSFKVNKSVKTEKESIQLITFSFTADTPSELQPVSIRFSFPSIDINGFWNPKIDIDRVNYYSSGLTSKASRNAPVLSFYNNALQNRITISLSDALNQSEIVSYLKEEDVHFHPEIKLFHEKMPKTTAYEITLRIDTRSIPYFKAIDEVASWWAKHPDYRPMRVPQGAKRPMYSTWYSYHQNISAAAIVSECKIAKSLGCGALIVDDGWQTNDGNRGYAYTGDWVPVRTPDMKGFVEAVHNEGMQFLLWYSLPFMGEKAKNYPKFKGKYLRYWESQGTYVLDPRYPEVREFIVNTYIKALQDWGLDGFKLDFIGRFTANPDTKLTKEDGRDFAGVNDATNALMTEITSKLTAIKPDILIEFRQPYIGPLMRKFGNMFRGVDAPNNAVANRIETTNLRLLSQNTAVHSDMFIWRSEETVEKAALQILNIIYSVPQLSVKLAEIPDTHLEMIRYWFDYWNTNKHVLLDGDFIPSNPVANYPSLTAVKEGHQITTIYDDVIISVSKNIKEIDIINARVSTSVAMKLESNFEGNIVVKDCMGKTVLNKDIYLSEGITELTVPESGIALLRMRTR
ncbi:MAG: alpha-galactosidase [Aureibaculum sp.]|nr:alpha-galactosidase [Aureibaculum sp.]